MSMFRKYKTLLLIFVFTLTLLLGLHSIKVYADSKDIEITNIGVKDKSGTITVSDPVFALNEVSSEITFNELNDFVTFELELQNNESMPYQIDSITDNNTNSNLEITYDYGEEFVYTGNTTKILVTMTYKNKLWNVDHISLNDLTISINLIDFDGAQERIIVNPDTGAYIYHFLVLLIISLTGLYFIRKKLGKYLFTLCLLMIPFMVLAIELYTINIHFTDVNIIGEFQVFDVPVSLNDGTAPDVRHITYGEPLGALPTPPTRTGYNFTGWTDGEGNSVTTETVVTGPMEVTAQYDLIEYNITYTLNGGSANNKTTYTVEDEFTLVNPTKKGYTFAGWTGSNGTSYQTSVTVHSGTTGPLNYEAHYSTNPNTPYKVLHKYQNLDLTTYTEVVQNLTGPTDEEISPALSPRDGFISPSTQTTTISGEGDTVVEYVYQRRQFTFSITDRTYVENSTSDGEYYYETEITVKAQERPGYSFTWSDGDTDYERTFPLEDNTTLTPQYTANTNTPYKVLHKKMNLDGETYETTSTLNLTGTTDSEITPAVNTYTGFISPSTQTTTINGNGSTVVEYLYEREQYAFSITDRTYIVDSTANGTYYYETEITVKAQERPGYSFKWSDNNTDYERTFTLEEPTTLTPIYTANTNTPYTVLHKQRNLGADTYATVDTDNLTGTTDSEITPAVKTYTGFISPSTQTTTINGDGSTVVEYLYEREEYAFTITDRTYVYNSTENGTYPYETSITVKAQERAGYSFKWSDDNTDYERTFALFTDTTLTPVYTANTNTPYTVIHKQMDLDGQGYTTVDTENLTGTTDSTITPAVNTYPGFDSPNAQTTTISGNGDTVVEYLYVRQQYTFTITDRTYVEETTANGTYYYGTSVTMKAIERAGYSFEWSDGETAYQRTFTLEGNVSLTPVYTADTDTPYTVLHEQMNLNGEGYTIVSTLHETGTTDSEITPTVNTYPGFDSPSPITTTISGNGDTVVEYFYVRQQYAFSITDRTYVTSDSTANGTYYYGTSITAKAQERAGYSFEWSDGETNYERTFTLSAATSLTPVYTANTNTPYTVLHKQKDLVASTYTLADTDNLTGTTDSTVTPAVRTYTGFISPSTQTTTISGNGDTVVEYLYDREEYAFSITDRTYVYESTPDGTYEYGTSITVKAQERSGYTFTWSDGDTNYIRTFTLTEDKILTPTYTAEGDTPYTVIHKQMNLDGTTYTTVSTLNLKGETGAEITPVVNTYPGFDSPNPQTTTINGDGSTVVEYYYTRQQYAFSISDRTYVYDSTPDDTYYYGTSITVKAQERAGYSFEWSDGDSNYVRTFTLEEPTTLTPVYTANTNTPYTVLHKQKDLGTNTYTLADTDNLTGTTDSTVTPAVRTYTGFISPSTQTVTISGNGDTVVEYLYDREEYAFSISDRTYVYESTPDGTYEYGTSITAKAQERDGYSFEWSDGETDYVRTFPLEGINTLTPVYTANTNTPYTVVHKQRDLGTNTYTTVSTLNLTGTTDAEITPTVNSYTGFISPSAQTTTINGNGSTVVEYLYEREEYAFSISDRTYITSDSTANGTYPYETSITAKAQERAGYSFEWNDGVTDYERTFTLTADTTLTPVYTANTNTPYTVVHKQRDLEAATYTTVSTLNLTGTTDAEITPTVNTYTGFVSPSAQTTTISGNGDTVVEYLYEREQLAFSITDRTYVYESTANGTYDYGKSITVKAQERAGYTFKWSDNDTDYIRTFTLTSATTLNPIYTANTNTPYTVLHKQKDLGANTYTTVDAENLTGTTDATITPNVNTYTGFISPSTQTTTISGNGDTVVEYLYDREEYAFSITNRTYVYESTANGTYEYGTSITVKAQERAGYTFEWSDGDSNYIRTFPLSSATTLNPTYTANTNTPYTVLHKQKDLGANTYTTVSTQNLTGTTDATITPSVNTYTGFISPSTQTTTISGNGDTVVEYLYDREEYTFSITDRTYVYDSTLDGTYEYGTSITVKAQERAGYTFKWSDDNTDYVRTFTLTADTTLTTVYTATAANVTYTVLHKKMDLNGLTYTTVSTLNLVAPAGSSVTPAVNTYTGFTSPSTQTVTISASGDTVVEYLYIRNQYHLTLVHPEYISQGDLSGDYYYEEQVSLTAISRSGYLFTGWSNEETTPNITITIESNITLEPLYSPNQITVHFNSMGGTTVADRTITYGDPIGTLPTSKKTDLVLDGWYTLAGVKVDHNYSPTEEITLYAHWNEPICIPATEKLSEPCNADSGKGCRTAGYETGDDIEYGVIYDDTLVGGTAFDCKVTTTGGYDDRFYYIRTDNENAVLVHHSIAENGVVGPTIAQLTYTDALTALPNSTSWDNLNVSFTLDDNSVKPARLLTKDDVLAACGTLTGTLTSCEYLYASTGFAANTGRSCLWLTKDGTKYVRLRGDTRKIDENNLAETSKNSSKPVIEVPFTYLYIDQLEKYTVHFETYDYDGPPVADMEVIENTAIGTLPSPTWSSYDFGGWYEDENFTTPVTTSTIITQDVTFYAKWVDNNVAVMNGTRYATVSAAVADAPTNTQTLITLISNTTEPQVTIPTNKNIILDLAGYTITHEGNASNTQAAIENSGVLYLKNGTVRTGSRAAAVNNRLTQASSSTPAPVMTIEDLEVYSTGARQAVYNEGIITIQGDNYFENTSNERAAVQNESSATMTIISAEIVSINHSAVRNTGTLTIGTKLDGVDVTTPIFVGKGNQNTSASGSSQYPGYGIYSTQNFAFYDGIAKGKVGSINVGEARVSDYEPGATYTAGTETIDSDTYQTAYYTQGNTYTVSFDANGGTVSPTFKIVNIGSQIGELPVPDTRTNYHFDGWFTQAGIEVTSSTIPTGHLQCIAEWSYEDNNEIVHFNIDSDAMSVYYQNIDTWKNDQSTFQTNMDTNFAAHNCSECVGPNYQSCNTPAAGTVLCDQSKGYPTGISGGVNVFLSDETTKVKGAQVTYTTSDTGIIYNMIPGVTYYWESIADSTVHGYVKASGNFRTIHTTVRNVRDIGGLSVDVDGDGNIDGALSYGRIFRGAKLSSSSTDSANLAKLGITEEIDLRAASDGASDAKLALYQNREITNYLIYPDTYATNYATFRAALRQTMIDIASGENVYFHCKIGTDRTGTMAFFLEGLLGVSHEDKLRDYELSYFYGLLNRHRFHDHLDGSAINPRFTTMANTYNTNQKIYTWFMSGSSDITGDQDIIEDFRESMIPGYTRPTS